MNRLFERMTFYIHDHIPFLVFFFLQARHFFHVGGFGARRRDGDGDGVSLSLSTLCVIRQCRRWMEDSIKNKVFLFLLWLHAAPVEECVCRRRGDLVLSNVIYINILSWIYL